MSNLTPNTINQIICIGDPPEGFSPTLQILSVRPIQVPPDTQGERYRVVISDGVYFAHGMLAKQLNHFIHSGSITEFSVVRVLNFMTAIVSNKNVVILLNLELVNNPGLKIGNPVAVTDAPVMNTGMKQQQPPNEIHMYNSGKEAENSVTTNNNEEEEKTTTKRNSRSTRIGALPRENQERSPSPPPVPILVPIINSKSSSSIQEAGYDELTNDLYVKWFGSDVVYQYQNVPTSVLRDCEKTQSFGRYMSEFKKTAHGESFKRNYCFKWTFKEAETVVEEIASPRKKVNIAGSSFADNEKRT